MTTARKTTRKPRALAENALKKAMTNAGSTALVVSNGLTEAILGGGTQGYGTPISQLDTLMNNNRWAMISNMRQILSQIYIEHGLVRTIVDVPVDDAMRGGVEIKSKQLSPEQIEDLHSDMEREDILNSVVGQSQKWNRLYGGGGILILTEQDPQLPLDVDAITDNTRLEFRALDLWELYQNVDNTEDQTTTSEHTALPDVDIYTYYGHKVHKTRVMKMRGLTAPSYLRPRLRGWGISVVETLVRSINQYLKSNNLAFEVLDEFKLDIFKINNLTQTLLDRDGTSRIQNRIQLANYQKNFQNALTMDKEDDYEQKQLSFAGLADVMKEIRMQIASDMRMPLTKLFGLSATGFNSGEDDIENYNAMVESQVRAKSKYEILRILELKCQHKYGFIPDDLQISFKPLRVLSSTDEETVRTQKFTRLLQARQAGEISAKEFKDGCNRDNLLPVQLDTSQEALDEADEDDEDMDGSESDDETDEADESDDESGTGTDVDSTKTVTAEKVGSA